MYEDNALYGCLRLMLYYFLITRISKSHFYKDNMHGVEIYIYADFIYNNKVQVRCSDFFYLASVDKFFTYFDLF